jgi:hypothetical protein
MSREYRVQDRTRQKLADLNKRVSNKKSRYRREKGIELNPHIQTVKPSDFTSRKELEKYVRSMERFLDRKTQYVQNNNKKIFTTETVRKYEKEVERINKIKEREYQRIQNLETQIKGKKLDMTVGERMEKAPKSLFPNLTKLTGGLDRFSSEKELKQTIKNQFQEGYFKGNFIKRADRQYKQNFIQSLETVFGGKSAHLRKKLNGLSLTDFMNVYYETTGTIDIDYNYEESESNESKLKTLERTFRV